MLEYVVLKHYQLLTASTETSRLKQLKGYFLFAVMVSHFGCGHFYASLALLLFLGIKTRCSSQAESYNSFRFFPCVFQLTPKEAFRLISHKFHGKGPGKTKQEKRIREYHEELKVKQMKNSDTPSESVERMREAQARLKTPYLVLSGNVKPGYAFFLFTFI